MLTELALTGPASAAIGFDELFPDQVDPLAKECTEQIPCRVSDGDLWFAEDPRELEQAKALCDGCPARIACLTGAIERREPWGVWGGEIFERGVIVARKRPRGRPRKNPLPEPAVALAEPECDKSDEFAA